MPTTMVKMRVPDDVLERIDAEAERRGITRTALLLDGWLKASISASAGVVRPAGATAPDASGTSAAGSVVRSFACPLHPNAGGVIGRLGFLCDECRSLRPIVWNTP